VLKNPPTNEIRVNKIVKKSVFAAIVVSVVLGMASAQTAPAPAQGKGAVMSRSANTIRAGHILVRFKTTPAQDVLSQLNTAFGEGRGYDR